DNCKKPALVREKFCLNLTARRGDRCCPECGACTHWTAKPGDKVCPICGLDLVTTSAPHKTDERSSICPEPDCRRSTYRCLIHDPVLPDCSDKVQPGSTFPSWGGESFFWCGLC